MENCAFYGFRESTPGPEDAEAITATGFGDGQVNVRVAGCAFADNYTGVFFVGLPTHQSMNVTIENNTLIGPGKENFDLSLHKRFRFMEKRAADVRWDTFNSLNHAQFSNPSGSQASSSFGKITSAGDGRIMQVALRIEF